MRTWIGNPANCDRRVLPPYPLYKFTGEAPPESRELRPCPICGERHVATFSWRPVTIWAELDRGGEQVDLSGALRPCDRDDCEETARWGGRCPRHA